MSELEGGTPFREDYFERPGGGHGRSRVLQGGAGERVGGKGPAERADACCARHSAARPAPPSGTVFEKAAVLVSVLHGDLPPAAAAQMLARGKDCLRGPGPFPFYVAGLSLVIHPHNP